MSKLRTILYGSLRKYNWYLQDGRSKVEIMKEIEKLNMFNKKELKSIEESMKPKISKSFY